MIITPASSDKRSNRRQHQQDITDKAVDEIANVREIEHRSVGRDTSNGLQGLANLSRVDLHIEDGRVLTGRCQRRYRRIRRQNRPKVQIKSRCLVHTNNRDGFGRFPIHAGQRQYTTHMDMPFERLQVRKIGIQHHIIRSCIAGIEIATNDRSLPVYPGVGCAPHHSLPYHPGSTGNYSPSHSRLPDRFSESGW